MKNRRYLRKVRYVLTVAAAISVLVVLRMTIHKFVMKHSPKHLHIDEYDQKLTYQKTNKKKPHILLIVADDLGFNDVGYHGSDIKTPNIDDLAKTGVRLENYYVQRCCTPTRGQLLSGRYEVYTGLSNIIAAAVPIGLPLDSPTIADKLKEAGYSTHMVGKWHVGFFKEDYLPTSRGFDTFFGIPTGNSDYYNYTYNNYFLKEPYRGVALMENDHPADIDQYRGRYSTHLYANKVKKIVQSNTDDKPLFMVLSFQAPHTPLQVPDSYLDQYENVTGNRKPFSAMVTCMDEAIGEIVEVMKKQGLWDDTVLIFTSDNGGPHKHGADNTPLKGDKGNVWEGGIRVPGFIHSQLLDTKRAGTVYEGLMHVTDWFPTLVHIGDGNLKGTKPLSGFDQWNSIKNGDASRRTEILHHISPDAPLHTDTYDAAIRIGDWKLIKGFKGHRLQEGRPVSLINIKNDPTERNDLSAKHPATVQNMLARIEYYRKQMVYRPYPDIDPNANPKFHNGFWVPWR